MATLTCLPSPSAVLSLATLSGSDLSVSFSPIGKGSGKGRTEEIRTKCKLLPDG